MYCACNANRTGRIPIFCTFDTLKPIGKVSTLELFLAYQLTRMFGEVPTLQPYGRK